jgi:hypothetical protein
MRKLFIVLFFLLLTSLPTFAGTDDSGLQVYTITGDKLLPMAPEAALTSDNPYANIAVNCINVGNGLQKYTGGQRLFTTPASGEVSIYPYSISKIGRNVIWVSGWDVANATIEVGIVYGDDYAYYNDNITKGTFYSKKSLIGATAETDLQSYSPYMPRHFKIYPYIDTTLKYAMVVQYHSQLWRSDLSSTMTMTTYPTISGSVFRPSTSAVYKNRLFMMNQAGNVVFSQSAVYHNFTSSETAGGVINLPSYSGNVQVDMAATKDALYLFRTDGIWIISGNGTLSYDFTVEKLSSDSVASYGSGVITAPNDVVYFMTASGFLKKIEGTIVTSIASAPLVPVGGFIAMQSASVGDRFLAFTRERISGYTYDSVPTHAYLYDLLSNTWSIVTNITALSPEGYMASAKALTYLAPFYGAGTAGYDIYDMSQYRITHKIGIATIPLVRGDTQFRYETNWLTLDGSEANIKTYKRMEIDYEVDTEGVYFERNYLGVFLNPNGYYYSYDFIPTQMYNWGSSYVSALVLSGKNSTMYAVGYDTAFNTASNYGVQPYKTLTIPLNMAGSNNSLRLNFTSYSNNIRLKAIRIYYVPLGSYKQTGNKIN